MKDYKGGRLAGKRDRGVKASFQGSQGVKHSRFGSTRFNYTKNSQTTPIIHQTVCSTCGVLCEVTFTPTEGKPVYCKECIKGTPFDQSKNKAKQQAAVEIVEKPVEEVTASGEVSTI